MKIKSKQKQKQSLNNVIKINIGRDKGSKRRKANRKPKQLQETYSLEQPVYKRAFHPPLFQNLGIQQPNVIYEIQQPKPVQQAGNVLGATRNYNPYTPLRQPTEFTSLGLEPIKEEPEELMLGVSNLPPAKSLRASPTLSEEATLAGMPSMSSSSLNTTPISSSEPSIRNQLKDQYNHLEARAKTEGIVKFDKGSKGAPSIAKYREGIQYYQDKLEK